MKKIDLLFKILAVVALVIILILAVLSPRWAARPEDVRAAAPTPIPTWAPSPTPEPTPTPDVTPTPEPTPEPTATPTPEPTPETFTISLVGDCTMASYPEIRAWDISYENVVGEDYGYPFKNTKDIFSADDMSIINLECSISDLQAWSASTFSFEASTGTLQSLTEGSIEFATTANNHAMDFGQEVYDDTAANLDSVGIGHCGDGEGVIHVTDSGLAVGVYATYNGNWPDANQVAAGVQALKDQGAEVVVVSAHWGDEASYYTNENQRTVAHAAIDAGANIIMGSGPHRLEPFEEYNGGIIFYSLGNFIFGGNTLPADMDSAIGQVTIQRDLDGTISVLGFDVYPCSISSQATVNDYCPTLFDKNSEEYDRCLSKMDGRWTGVNDKIDYSFMHQDEVDG